MVSIIRYAVVQWREVEVPEGALAPSGRRRADELVSTLGALGVLHRTPGFGWVATDGANLACDNEYGYDDYVEWVD